MLQRPAYSLPRWLRRWLPRQYRRPAEVPEGLWSELLGQHAFFSSLSKQDRLRLRWLVAHFLEEKEFYGANGLAITDPMALAISAQACLPLLHMARPDGVPPSSPLELLDWYGDFVGIVVQPGAAIAKREWTDEAGIVHRYREVLAGEAMHGGPVMLSWEAVVMASQTAAQGHNLVIHEFAHKLDMHGQETREGHADGAPPLPRGFNGHTRAGQAREHWRVVMQTAYDSFCESVSLAERFGGPQPWLDDYAAQSPAEFFAVTSEAYFVNRAQLQAGFPAIVTLYDGFYRCA